MLRPDRDVRRADERRRAHGRRPARRLRRSDHRAGPGSVPADRRDTPRPARRDRPRRHPAGLAARRRHAGHPHHQASADAAEHAGRPDPDAAAAGRPPGGLGHGEQRRHGSTGSDSGSTADSGTATAASTPVSIDFKKDAAQTYDPTKRAGAEFGPAAFAIDSKLDTVWDVTVPADGQPIAAGLVIDLGKPYALRSLRLGSPTDGFTVEVYGAKSAKELPEDVIDKRWIHLTDKKFVLDDEPILLKGKGDGAKVQLLLLHFTTPADPDDPRVAISNVKLRGTP